MRIDISTLWYLLLYGSFIDNVNMRYRKNRVLVRCAISYQNMYGAYNFGGVAMATIMLSAVMGI